VSGRDVRSFLQRLIRIPSPSGDESDIARLVLREMKELEYDEAWIDEAGNVVGRIKGRSSAPPVVLNTHLDHVDAGDPNDWDQPPFAARVVNGRVWGRGAVDIKGPLAAQVYAGGQLKAAGNTPASDLWVTSVVQEEVGGLGARHLVEQIEPGLVVVGEASSNELRRGHRGRGELCVELAGRSVHASAPERGINPVESLTRVLERLGELNLPTHPKLGRATVTPTTISTNGESTNVTPASVVVICDCRLIPDQSLEDLKRRVETVLADAVVDPAAASVSIPRYHHRSYSGLEMEMPADCPAFILPADHPALISAQRILSSAMDRQCPVKFWTFSSDGGHFAKAGHTVIGFGPGDEALAHTVRESIELESLDAAVTGYAALGRLWAESHRV